MVRGPRPSPDALLRLHGSDVPRRRETSPTLRPQPALGIPETPTYLCAEGRKVWKRVTSLLSDMGILTVVDGFCLGRYCAMLVHWTKLEKLIQSGAADDKQRTEARQFSTLLLKIEVEFGLLPASRTRLCVQEPAAPSVASRKRSKSSNGRH